MEFEYHAACFPECLGLEGLGALVGDVLSELVGEGSVVHGPAHDGVDEVALANFLPWAFLCLRYAILGFWIVLWGRKWLFHALSL